MKTAKQSFSKNPYICKQEWPEDCFVQCGGHGIVITDKNHSIDEVLSDSKSQKEVINAMMGEESSVQHYKTAFFEAFPKDPSCFIRGEGTSIEEAELKCFEKFLKIRSCTDHEFDRRGREDGYAYCTKCPYSSMVLEPLTNCDICKKPAHYGSDLKGNWYCETHYFKQDVNNIFEDIDRNKTSRKYFVQNSVKAQVLSHTKMFYAIIDPKEYKKLKDMVDQMAIDLELRLIYDEKKDKKEVDEILLDPVVYKVLVNKALPYIKSN